MKRRTFVKQTALGLAGTGFSSVFPRTAISRTVAPSDKINIALIGTRNMGFGILKNALSFPDVNCVAMCDIDSNLLNERAQEVTKNFQFKPKLYKDFRKLLENRNIDAVIVGTPDHWHCLNTIYACQADKDVYVEKPMANTIGECNIMLRAAKRYKRIIQVGQQQRSAPIFQKAMELIKGGELGKLRKVNIWANFKYGVGPQVVPDTPVPPGVDFDMWLGPAPLRSFNPNRFHGNWRHFWDYGGGLMSDWGVHLIDMALWSREIVEGPKEALTFGTNSSSEVRMRETFDTMSITYPKNDFVINYDLTAGVERGPYDKPYGLAFIGDNATLVVNREYLEVFPEWDGEKKVRKASTFKMTGQDEGHRLHTRNFLDCIKSRSTPNCPPEYGRAAALHVHTANISARIGQPHLLWNDQKNEFTNSAEANALITPHYRSPWTLPSI
ncbi:Gfo/Idh/MocA family protein [Daejeonella sp.]|uniref:Gfo/Idh/MocA family protein n=1 Tax=Daejeonella sp. TaxID=2805397 RepID=UPI003983952A